MNPILNRFVQSTSQLALQARHINTARESVADVAQPEPDEIAASGFTPSRVDELSVGSYGQSVKDLQQQLSDAGFSPGPVDGDYGPLTHGAVERFQQSNIQQLEQQPGIGSNQARDIQLFRQVRQLTYELDHRVAGVQTQALLESGATRVGPVLAIGSRGSEVISLQNNLVKAGYRPGPVDGIYGPLTHAAVESFQLDTINLSDVSGENSAGLENEFRRNIVGPATQARLEQAASVDPSDPAASASDIDAQVEAVYNTVPAAIRRAHPEVHDDIKRILEQTQAAGLTQQQTAYVLATATHENNLGQFAEELSSGRQYNGRPDLGNTEPGDGPRFKGRGYVQITGRRNYTDWSNRLGIDLVNNPELAADPEIAAQILVIGMRDGTFTGRRLDRYINDEGTDFTNARRVVNGTDKASTFAATAESYNSALATASVPVIAGDADPSSVTDVVVGAEGSDAPLWKKSTANISNLDPRITRIFDEIVQVWGTVVDKTPVITSGNDGRHTNGSRHYRDLAIDLRANNISDEDSARIESLLEQALGPDYFVDFEHFPGNVSNDHIHISYRPGAPA